MQNKDQELNDMLKKQQRNQLSSDQEELRQELTSKSQYRKPIRDPFSDDSDDSDLGGANYQATGTPFPPKPPQQKSVLQQLQGSIKWDKNEQLQIQILTKLEGQGMKDKKIRQLASKYKALNVAYEKQKTQRKNIQNQLNQSIKASQQAMRNSSHEKTQRKSLQKSQVKNSTQKCPNCIQNEKKVCQFRLKSQNMKSELNKVMRLLTRQLGENFDVDKALSDETGWKGRQQKIQRLKAKVRELEQKLQNNGINVSHMSGFTQVTNNNNRTGAFQTTRSSAMLAENKRKELQNLKVQVDGLKSENQLLQGKVKSLTSRKLILENEMKQLKNDFEKKRQVFIEKSQNDDKFIALLKNQNEKLKRDERVVTKVIYKDEGDTSALKQQIQTLKKKIKILMSERQKTSQAPKQPKDLNSRVLSAQKKKHIEQEYLKGNKYLKKLSNEDQEEIYKNWKKSLKDN